MNTTGLKLAVYKATNFIEGSKLFGCMEKYNKQLSPIADLLRKKNLQLINKKLLEQAYDNDTITQLINDNNLYEYTSRPITFRYSSIEHRHDTDLYLYYSVCIYDRIISGHKRLAETTLRVERTWYFFLYKLIEALIGDLPF